jgi:hypothetical protein
MSQFKRIVAVQYATGNIQKTAHKSLTTEQQAATITVKYNPWSRTTIRLSTIVRIWFSRPSQYYLYRIIGSQLLLVLSYPHCPSKLR